MTRDVVAFLLMVQFLQHVHIIFKMWIALCTIVFWKFLSWFANMEF